MEGAPIGLEISGAVARLILIYFDLEFNRILNYNQIDLILYRRYADDNNTAAQKIRKGYKYNTRRKLLEYCEQQLVLYVELSGDKKTFQVLK